MNFPIWASQWYFSPKVNQKAQLLFKITMESSPVCLFWANPTGSISDLLSLFSNTRGWLCFKFPPAVSCSNGLPLSFNPCVGGEGLPWSDAIVPVKSRADRGCWALRCWLCTLCLPCLKVYWDSRSLSLATSHFPLECYHFFLTPS